MASEIRIELGISGTTELREWLEEEEPEFVELVRFEERRPDIYDPKNGFPRRQANEESTTRIVVEEEKIPELMEAIGEVVEE